MERDEATTVNAGVYRNRLGVRDSDGDRAGATLEGDVTTSCKARIECCLSTAVRGTRPDDGIGAHRPR
jgi:hypothetical protein